MKLDHVLRLSVRACEGGINEITLDRHVDNEATVIDAVNMFLAAIGVSARASSLLNNPIAPRFSSGLGSVRSGSGGAVGGRLVGGGEMSGY